MRHFLASPDLYMVPCLESLCPLKSVTATPRLGRAAYCHPCIVYLLGLLMPPKVDMNPESWMYHFERCYQAALDGRHLPTLEELYCGMAFFRKSLVADAKAWSEHIIPYLAEKGQKISRNRVQIALERLTVSASFEDLKFVHGEITKYMTSSEIFAEMERAERRLVFYRVASGDETAYVLLFQDLMFRNRWLTSEAAGSGWRTR